jgi:hypothetical protein
LEHFRGIEKKAVFPDHTTGTPAQFDEEMQEGLSDRTVRGQLEHRLTRCRLFDLDLQVRQRRHPFDARLFESFWRGEPG